MGSYCMTHGAQTWCSDSLEGWDRRAGHRRDAQEGGAYVYLWLIPVIVWQKPIQHCRAIILQ